MCGIAGIVNHGDAAQGADTQALVRMAARMRPRGPDGEGQWRSPDGRAALAATVRRLPWSSAAQMDGSR